MKPNDTADLAAKMTLDAFDSFDAAFQTITRRAKQRFEEKDWVGGRRDASDRLDLYENTLDYIAIQLDRALGEQAREQSVWVAAKERFPSLVGQRYDLDRAETFFNSVTRKMLNTVGINREVEFFYLYPKAAPVQHGEAVYRTYIKTADTSSLVRNILEDFPFHVGYENIERDAELVAQEIDLHLWPIVGVDKAYTIDVVKAIFYRNKEAYIVARIVVDARAIPLDHPVDQRRVGNLC